MWRHIDVQADSIRKLFNWIKEIVKSIRELFNSIREHFNLIREIFNSVRKLFCSIEITNTARSHNFEENHSEHSHLFTTCSSNTQ